MPAIRRDARCREEVVARLDDARRSRAVDRQGHDLVHDAVGFVAFAHTDQMRAVRSNDAVGVAMRRLRRFRRDGDGRAAVVDAVQALVSEVGENGGHSADRDRAAAVLVDACPGVELRGHGVGDAAVRRAPYQHVSSALIRTALDPVERVTARGQVAEVDASARQDLRGDRRAPGSVRGSRRHAGTIREAARRSAPRRACPVLTSRPKPRQGGRAAGGCSRSAADVSGSSTPRSRDRNARSRSRPSP